MKYNKIWWKLKLLHTEKVVLFSGEREINSGTNLQRSCGQVIVTGNFPKYSRIYLTEICALGPTATGLVAELSLDKIVLEEKQEL